MADTPRIEELRRRVLRDPASIAFAQLAEEYRRAGRFDDAIATCESGLAHHPGYLSARVTLGRSLLERGELDAAQQELKQVLRAAPENLAALRGLAEIHHQRGELREALAHYRTALEFARQDPELEQLVDQITRELEPRPAAPDVVDGMSFEEAKDAFLSLSVDGISGPEADAQAAMAEPTAAALPDQADDPHETFTLPAVPVATEDELAAAAPAVDDPSTPAPADDPSTPAEEFAVPAHEATHASEAASPVPENVAISEAASPVEYALASVDEGTPSWSTRPETATSNAWLPAEVAPPDVEAVTPGLAGEMPAQNVATSEEDAAPRVDALERWLEAILADRQRRS